MLTAASLLIVLVASVTLLTLSVVGLALPAMAVGYLAGVSEIATPLRRVLGEREA